MNLPDASWGIGRRAGPALRSRSRSARLRAGMDRAEHLLGRHGCGRAVVSARFVPVVRTVTNPVAGALRIPTATFALRQVVGGVVWSVGLVLLGHLPGASVPGVDRYLLPIVAVIVVVSLIPVAVAVAVAVARSRRSGGTT